jgi:hypothetical protein
MKVWRVLLIVVFAAAVSVSASPFPTWPGSWETTFPSYLGGTGEAPLSVSFEPKCADCLDGTWTSTRGRVTAIGWMHGRLTARTWHGVWWTADPAQHGEFTLTLDRDGNHFSGTYTTKNEGDKKTPAWTWTGIRMK